MATTEPSQALWVCWTLPAQLPKGHATLLSFLSPSDEDALATRYHGRLIRGREASRAVRDQARALYLELVAELGVVPCGRQGTLRQALARPGHASRWWYHGVSFRDCESDSTFRWIIAVLTIRAIAAQKGCAELLLLGAPAAVVRVLQSRFRVREMATQRVRSSWRIWLHALMSRFRYAGRACRDWWLVRGLAETAQGFGGVAILGFWDWSVSWNASHQQFTDRYLKRLPQALTARGMSPVKWLTWFDPHGAPKGKRNGRSLRSRLAPLKRQSDVIVLQALLSPHDFLRVIADFIPLATFMRVRRQPAFLNVFRREGMNYYPLFEEPLLRGFLDPSIPHHELIAVAMERACRRYQPKTIVSFLEHFPFARACYEGVRRSGGGAQCCAVQHASYNHEKTFLFLHPSLEFHGEPDGCPVPHPDYVCAMGTLGHALFRECGYPSNQVLLTGSPRYDHVKALPSHGLIREDHRWAMAAPPSSLESLPMSVLIVSGLDVEQELEMVDAACAAIQGLEGVTLLLRNHPVRRIDAHPGFARYADRVQVTQSSLEADLERADLILFSYSTVAEEVFVAGKPVWQWLPLGFNGSALSEAVTIPQFGSVADLRDALRTFRSDAHRFAPSREASQRALEWLFYRGDGGGAERVASAIGQWLS